MTSQIEKMCAKMNHNKTLLVSRNLY